MTAIGVITEKCTGCGACVYSCPERIFRMAEKGASFTVHEDLCIACGHCAAVCPEEAVIHPAIPKSLLSPISLASLASPDSLMGLLRKRRTYRAFEDRGVERGKIERIIEAASAAPSAHNTRGTMFTVVSDRASLRSIISASIAYYTGLLRVIDFPISRFFMARFAGRDFGNIVRDMREIVEFNAVGKDAVLFDAPCLILFHAKKSPRFPQINAHLALQNAILMAESLGLGSFVAGYVLMAFMYKKKLSRIVEIPKDHVAHGALGVGYPRFPFSHIIERGAPAVKWL